MAKGTDFSPPAGSSPPHQGFDRNVPVGVVIVEPEPERRAHLTQTLETQRDFLLLAQAGSIGELRTLGPFTHRPLIAVVNLDQAETESAGSWAVLRSQLSSDVRIVGLTDAQRPESLRTALILGLAALLPARVGPTRLLEALTTVAQGGIDFDLELTLLTKQALVPSPGDDTIEVGGLAINLKAQHVKRWGRVIPLSQLEFGVMVELAKSIGAPVTIAALLEAVWGASPGEGGTPDQVKSCIKRLQRKLEPDPSRPRYIVSVRSKGYILRDPYFGNLRP